MQPLLFPNESVPDDTGQIKTFTKDSVIEALLEIRRLGWIPNSRPENPGGVGNTLEDLLGIEENNLPIADAGLWELKCQRAETSALLTLFHMEPWPRALRFVPKILLPKYGWPHQEAGTRYPHGEMSFRQTIKGVSRSDRGFQVVVDRAAQEVLVSFDHTAVAPKHAGWLASVEKRVGLGELDPQPYWRFDDLFSKAKIKLLNAFFVEAKVRKEEGVEFFQYTRILVLEGLSLDKFILALERGDLLVDFDARTGHNHGTKFRLRRNKWPDLYNRVEEIT